MVSETGLRESFQKVRADIQDIRKSLEIYRNDLSKYPDKKEFYDFVKALDSRLKGIESSVEKEKESVSGLEKDNKRQIAVVQGSVDDLKAELKKAGLKRDEIFDQLKQARKSIERLNSSESSFKETASRTKHLLDDAEKSRERVLSLTRQLSDVEVRLMEMPDYGSLKKRLDQIEDKLSETRNLVKEADVAELKAELSELYRDFSKLGNRFVGWSDVSKSAKKADAEIEHVNKRISGLIISIDSLRDSFLSKSDFQKIHEELKALKNTVNGILEAEVDLGGYALKSDLQHSMQEQRKELQKKIDEGNDRVGNLAKRLDEYGNSIDVLSARAEKAVSEMSRKISALEQKEKKAEVVVGEGSRAEGGLSGYVTAFVVITILVLAGYYLFNQINAPVSSNISTPSVMEPASNISSNFALMNRDCILRFECVNDSDGNYNYDCFFDSGSSVCRCFKGGSEKCDEQKLASLVAARRNESAVGEKGMALGNYWLYFIAIVSLLVFFAILFYLFRKGEEAVNNEDEQTKNHEEKHRKKGKG